MGIFFRTGKLDRIDEKNDGSKYRAILVENKFTAAKDCQLGGGSISSWKVKS